MAEKPQWLGSFTTRQKVTAGIFALVILFLLWQVIGLFRGGSSPTPAARPGIAPAGTAMSAGAPGGVGPQQPLPPQPAQLRPKEAQMSPREAELMKLQQETEAKYIEALNELQMLRITRDIAETNKAIAAAKLETVTAEKNIVDLLTKPAMPQLPAGAYGPGLVSPVPSGSVIPQVPQIPVAQQPPTPAISYVVISVSRLQNRWNAVLGSQGKLYNVSVGDVLPPDGSKVMSIDRTGVVIQKDGARKKLSMVSAI